MGTKDGPAGDVLRRLYRADVRPNVSVGLQAMIKKCGGTMGTYPSKSEILPPLIGWGSARRRRGLDRGVKQCAGGDVFISFCLHDNLMVSAYLGRAAQDSSRLVLSPNTAPCRPLSPTTSSLSSVAAFLATRSVFDASISLPADSHALVAPAPITRQPREPRCTCRRWS